MKDNLRVRTEGEYTLGKHKSFQHVVPGRESLGQDGRLLADRTGWCSDSTVVNRETYASQRIQRSSWAGMVMVWLHLAASVRLFTCNRRSVKIWGLGCNSLPFATASPPLYRLHRSFLLWQLCYRASGFAFFTGCSTRSIDQTNEQRRVCVCV